MKSIERRYLNTQRLNPVWSSYICFAEAVKKQGFSGQSLHRWFGKLVEKDDYAQSEKRQILAHLDELTKPLRTTKNKP